MRIFALPLLAFALNSSDAIAQGFTADELKTRTLRLELAVAESRGTLSELVPEEVRPFSADADEPTRRRAQMLVAQLRQDGDGHRADLARARFESDGVYLPYDTADRLRLAKEALSRSEPSPALEIVGPLLGTRARSTDPQVIDLYLRAQLELGRNAVAADWVIADRSADRQTPYTRFNLAVALMRAGRDEAAITVLYRLGQTPAADDEGRAIRDQANLALGWAFLARGQGASAKAAFHEVRLRGPQANAALLGIGWAELAPPGRQQPRDYVGDEASPLISNSLSPALMRRLAERRIVEPELAILYDQVLLPAYPRAQVSADEQTALGRATVAWRELQSRDPEEPFVWEGWVALPYALDKAGASAAAVDGYRTALANLQAQERRMEAQTADLLLNEALSAEPGGAGWLRRWAAASEVQVLREDIKFAQERIAYIEAVLGTIGDQDALEREARSLKSEWELLAKVQETELRARLEQQITSRKALLRRYRQSVHLALARLQDPQRVAPVLPPAATRSLWQRLGDLFRE